MQAGADGHHVARGARWLPGMARLARLRRLRSTTSRRSGYLLVAPVVLLLLGLVAYPFGIAVQLA